MSLKVIITLALLILSISACATKNINNPILNSKVTEASVSKSKIEPLSINKQDRVARLLVFIDQFSNDTFEAQKKSFNETNRLLTENKFDLTERIKLAIMLSLPSSRMRDTAKAQNQLQELLQENSLNPTESALTSLLYEYALDNIKQLQKNKDDLKKFEVSQQKLESLQQKYDALDKKLIDLKNIEKTISDRDSKVINKPANKP
jgi:hypothetical protein